MLSPAVYRRNFILFFTEAILFFIGMTFISVPTVIPYFLDELNATSFQIGLAAALGPLGAFMGSPIFSTLVMRLPLKRKVYAGILGLQRSVFLLYVLLLPIILPNTQLAVILFLVAFGIFSFFVGSYAPFYLHLFTKCVQPNVQGRLRGSSSSIGNGVGILVSFLVGVLLKSIAFPYNFVAVLGIGSLFLMVNAGTFFLLEEPTETLPETRMTLWHTVRNFWSSIKESKVLRIALLGNVLLMASLSFTAYYTMYAKKSLGMREAELATMMIVGVVAAMLANMIFGMLIDRIGNGRVLPIAGMFSVFSGLFLLFYHHIFGVYAAYACSMIALAGYILSGAFFILRQSPHPEKSPIYIGVNSFLAQFVAAVLLIISGVVVDYFGFSPVFIAVMVCGILAVLAYIWAGFRGAKA